MHRQQFVLQLTILAVSTCKYAAETSQAARKALSLGAFKMQMWASDKLQLCIVKVGECGEPSFQLLYTVNVCLLYRSVH